MFKIRRIRRAITILEVIIAVAIFSLLVGGVTRLYLGAIKNNLRDSDQFKAEMYLQQGLEAARAIRDYNFSSLVNGTYGLSRTGNYWTFSGSSDINDGFTRTVTVSDVIRDSNCNIAETGIADPNSKKIITTINWSDQNGNPASVFATEYFTNWNSSAGCEQAGNFIIDLSGASLSSGDRRVIGVLIKNIGSNAITIDKITVFWDNGNLMEEVKIGSTIVWKHNGVGSPDGEQPSGSELEIDNYSLPAGSGWIHLDHFFYTGDMGGATFKIYFKMLDGTVKYEQITLY